VPPIFHEDELPETLSKQLVDEKTHFVEGKWQSKTCGIMGHRGEKYHIVW